MAALETTNQQVLAPLATTPGRLSEVWRLAWPHFIGNASINLSFVAGNAIAGRLGVEQLAALGIVFGILVPVNTALMTLVGASTAAFAEAAARKDGQVIRNLIWQLAWLIVMVASTLGLFCTLLPLGLAHLNTKPEVLSIVMEYLVFSVIGVVPLSMLVVLAAVLSAHKQVKIIMRAELSVAVFTILLTLFLSHPSAPVSMGAVGLSIAILVSHSLAAIWLFRQTDKIVKQHDGVSLRMVQPPRKSDILDAVQLGGPLALATLIRLGARAVIIMIAVRAGTIEVAAFQVANNVLDTLVLPIVSVASVVAILLGQAVATRPKDLLSELRTIVTVMVIVCGLLVTGLWIFSDSLVRVFTLNTEVIRLAIQSVLIVGALLMIRAVILVSEGCLTVARLTSITPIVSFIGNWVVAVPAAFALSYTGHASAPLLMLCLAVGSGVVALIQMTRAIRWLRNRALLN